ncbi:hypothetical protein CKO15_10835 [Halorhodospira abdelmalekii]|uniref:hypothetical protein n=1 Tax=Halorhodospira abdelmalekii TaxID=421629 RepID=UPI00190748D8|nr:hypothetical protein [Halorhodospira abdelmalekii]MBK1735764.1 hypothetical protein [Halorhodospira abdelmalekii]
MTRERAAVYWDQLHLLEDEPFLHAVKSAVSLEEYFPTVARLRSHYRDVIVRRRQAQPPPVLPPPVNPDVAQHYIDKMKELLRCDRPL